MIIKCNKCYHEYETEFDVKSGSIYNCEKCNNVQVLNDIVWMNVTKDELNKVRPTCGSDYKCAKLKDSLHNEVVGIHCGCGFTKGVYENNNEVNLTGGK